MNNVSTVFNKREAGITLVELLISLAIFAILLLFLANFFVGYDDSFGYLQATTSVSQGTGLFINAVSNAVRQADQIIASRSFAGTTYTTNATTLVLELPSIDGSSTVISGLHDYMVFYLSSGNIYWRIESDASSSRGSSYQRLSSDVTSLSFVYNNADVTAATKVDVSVTTQKQVKGKTFQSSLTQQVYLRNK